MATRRSANLIAALVIAAAGRAAPAAEETSAVVAIQVRDGANLKTLGTQDGEVWLAGDGGRGDGRAGEDRPEGYPKAYPDKGESTDAWRVTKTGRGYTIQVSRARKWRGWYLSYDPGAPEKGCSWPGSQPPGPTGTSTSRRRPRPRSAPGPRGGGGGLTTTGRASCISERSRTS